MTDGIKPAGASITEMIDYSQSLAAVQARLDRTLHQADAVMSEVMAHLAQSGGKNFRASLLLAAAADESNQVPQSAVTAAAALELLHLATLVHDDIIDEAPTRRGLPSVQNKFGKKTAVIGGDYLFCLCLNLVTEISVDYPAKYADFSRAMTRICLGEINQYKHNGDTELSAFSYLKIIAGKTAALFALAMFAGGMLGGDSEPDARLLGRFGFYIGMLFQLADDCLDYESTTETFKKKTNHDLGEGVITLPLILHLADHPALKTQIRNKTLSAGEILTIVKEVVDSGSVARTWEVASRYHAKARKLLDRIPGSERRQRLGAILETIAIRKY